MTEKRPTAEQLEKYKKNAKNESFSADVRATFQSIVDKFDNIGKEVESVIEKKKETKPTTKKLITKVVATKQSKNDIELAKAEIKKRTGKTEEECESIVNEYRSLRAKSQERKKKEAQSTEQNKERVTKLKENDKIIVGTNEKTADAVIESTTKEVGEKIVKEITKIEQKAEVEAIKEVKKEMPKESTTEQNKAIAEKVEEKVKKETKTIVKNIVIDTSALLTTIAESLGKFDKDGQKEFLIKLRSDIDKLLSKYSYGGNLMNSPTQTFNITQSNMSASSVNPTLFNYGGGVNRKFMSGGMNEDNGGRVTKYVAVYFVQGNYGQGFEDLTAHDNRKDAIAEMRVYDDNESYSHRVIERRVLRSDYEKGKFANGGGVNRKFMSGGMNVDNKKRFLVDFYDSSDTNRDTSVEISIRANTLEDAIEDAIKKANEFKKNYIEFYHRHLFLGSINFAVSKEFRQGRGYNDFVNNRFADGGGVDSMLRNRRGI